MPIVVVNYPVYYQVMLRSRSQIGNFALCISLGCFEDLGDAVAKIVAVSRLKPGSDLGIVRTSIKDQRKFVPSSYERN